MVEPHMVRVLGRSAFHDTALTSSGDLSYLGGEVSLFSVISLLCSVVYKNLYKLIFASLKNISNLMI